LCAESEAARQLLAHDVKTFCSVPLLSHDRALGALNVREMQKVIERAVILSQNGRLRVDAQFLTSAKVHLHIAFQ
jgi:hypothetical protein